MTINTATGDPVASLPHSQPLPIVGGVSSVSIIIDGPCHRSFMLPRKAARDPGKSYLMFFQVLNQYYQLFTKPKVWWGNDAFSLMAPCSSPNDSPGIMSTA